MVLLLEFVHDKIYLFAGSGEWMDGTRGQTTIPELHVQCSKLHFILTLKLQDLCVKFLTLKIIVTYCNSNTFIKIIECEKI